MRRPPSDLAAGDGAARRFALAALAWGTLAMLVGILLGLELMVWQANAAPALGFGRMRPVHTTAVLFAFAGNLVFAGVYHSAPRLLGAPVAPRLAALHFWSWQIAVAAGLASLPLGIAQGGELAELEWPIDLAVLASWLVFAAQLASLVRRRSAARLQPPVWFYLATAVGVVVVHTLGNLALPVSLIHSYSLLGGAADALAQAWAREGLIAFLLVVPFFGLLYHALPAAIGRGLHSRLLVLVHFWGTLFAIGWLGAARLLDTALPDAIQGNGAAVGLLFWIPTWAAVLNGLLTARSAPPALRGDPVAKFTVAALLSIGLASIDTSILSTRAAATVAHYSDWGIGHVHLVGLGFTGMAASALLYWMVPRLWSARLHSARAAGVHFYLAALGVVLYVLAMAISGPTQSLMLRAERPEGGLAYGFIEALRALHVTHGARLVGGMIYLAGFLVMAWNLGKTVRAGRGAPAADWVEPVVPDEVAIDPRSTRLSALLAGAPPVICAVLLSLLAAAAELDPVAAVGMVFLALVLAAVGIVAGTAPRADAGPGWHRRLETRALGLVVLVAALLFAGGGFEVTRLAGNEAAPVPGESEPYSPLQLEGRDVYLAEGCRACHSQMIRPFLWEVARYGEVSAPSESLHDHPSQWGSRRVGPDLARIGGRYPNLWHHDHMIDPRAVTLGSTMPAYRHLAHQTVDLAATAGKMRALRRLGVPYTDAQIDRSAESAAAEGRAIALDLRQTGKVAVAPDSALVALIAYLQRVGQPP